MGLKDTLLFIENGLLGIVDGIKQLCPRAEFQPSTIHVPRKFLNKKVTFNKNIIEIWIVESPLSWMHVKK